MSEPWLLLVMGGVLGLLLVALVALAVLFAQVRRLPAQPSPAPTSNASGCLR